MIDKCMLTRVDRYDNLRQSNQNQEWRIAMRSGMIHSWPRAFNFNEKMRILHRECIKKRYQGILLKIPWMKIHLWQVTGVVIICLAVEPDMKRSNSVPIFHYPGCYVHSGNIAYFIMIGPRGPARTELSRACYHRWLFCEQLDKNPAKKNGLVRMWILLKTWYFYSNGL
jgi:hypothetical protein